MLDVSDGIPGAYAALMLHHAGATVARAEGERGDPLRRWRLAPGEPEGDGALYRYLRQGQTAVGIDGVPADAGGADVLIASPAADDVAALRTVAADRPELTVVSITAFGLDGPLAFRPASDLTIQAESGALAIRGAPDDRRCRWAAARSTGWPAPTPASPASRAGGRPGPAGGASSSTSLCDVANLGACNFMDLMHAIGHGSDARARGTDAGVGVAVDRADVRRLRRLQHQLPHQFDSFLRMIGAARTSSSPASHVAAMRSQRTGRVERGHPRVDPQHTTAEVVARAAELASRSRR